MNIVIVGCGTVGAAICMQLVKEGHDITVIDESSNAIGDLTSTCDVFGLVGNGANVAVLRKAGAEAADLLIAVTSGDEINILCCAAARHLGTRHTIARVRNPEYSELMHMMKGEMSLSMTINPELAAAREIYRMLRYPSAAKIDTLYRGRVELAELTVDKGSFFCNLTLREIRARMNIRFLICAVKRDGQVFIPSGDFRILAGDTISVTAPDDEITDLFKAIGAYKHPCRDVLIVGGGRITYYLQELLQNSRIRSTVIEKRKDLCRDLAEQYTCTVVCDNGTNQELLLQEGVGHVDALLALSEIDEENAIVSMFAKTQGTPKVVTMINTMSYVDFFKRVGLESIVSPKASTAVSILHFVRSMTADPRSEIESLHKTLDGRVEALEFVVKEEIEGLTGVPMKHLKPQGGVLVACIVHDDRIILPGGDDVISSGDTVIVVALGGKMHRIQDIMR